MRRGVSLASFVGSRRLVSHRDSPSETRVPDIQDTESSRKPMDTNNHVYHVFEHPRPVPRQTDCLSLLGVRHGTPISLVQACRCPQHYPHARPLQPTPPAHPRSALTSTISQLARISRSPAPKVPSCCNLSRPLPVILSLVGTKCAGGRLTVPRRGWLEVSPISSVLHHQLHNLRPPAQLDLRANRKRGK